ncbi:hypothetical protein ACOXXX_13890 [Thalassococcus sp. BH17M4-6]|uniref:hypothetical protein n=1 Tax=Thalassococcus sp. BH17M4-6 TaxID=3413148 RepID=UPI003BBCDF31
MQRPFLKAGVRSLIATIGIAIWGIWFDGPAWAWVLLLGYFVLTFGLAAYINKREQELRQTGETAKADIAERTREIEDGK